MFFTGATVAGSPAVANEDWAAATPDLVVVLDGATVRTETGCRHGAAWYTRKLGAAIIVHAANRSHPLERVLTDAIRDVAALHPGCDLTHPGTPSAGVAMARIEGDLLRYLVLGDVTVVLDTAAGIAAISDQRVSATASAERGEADQYLIGSPAKASALLRMKYAELGARNRPGGYWIAAADPIAVEHAITGEVALDAVGRLAILTDGAARAVDAFRFYGSWRTALDAIADLGPRGFIRRVREIEVSDPLGARYPRNKSSDDATVVFAEPVAAAPRDPESADTARPHLADEERIALADELLSRTLNAPGIYGDGMAQRTR